jgi:hypothetical protein
MAQWRGHVAPAICFPMVISLTHWSAIYEVVSTSRKVKAVVAGSLALMVAAAGVWAWFLSQQGVGEASEWSGVLQGFAAFLSLPALVIGVLALRGNEVPSADDDGLSSQRVSIGRIKAGGKVDIDVRQDRRP